MSCCAPSTSCLHPVDAINIRLGGLSFHGALIAGTLAFAFFAAESGSRSSVDRCHRSGGGAGSGDRSLGQLGQSGSVRDADTAPWGLWIDPDRRPAEFAAFERFHPTFLYESLFNLANAARSDLGRAPSTESTRLRHGDVLAIYLINYGVARFLIERIRTDSLYLGPLPAAFWLSWGLIAVGLGLLIFLRLARSRTPTRTQHSDRERVR